MKPLKAVFDSNVYLAASKKNGYARLHLQRAQPNGPYRLFISPEILIEVRRKLVVKFSYTTADAAKFAAMIMNYATLVQPQQKITGILQDTDDHIILECALEARADIIVSADRGLLKLKQFQGITIIHPTMLQYLL